MLVLDDESVRVALLVDLASGRVLACMGVERAVGHEND